MQKYSVFSLIKNSLSGHRNWDVAWKDPTPKKEYEVIIIGGGGHGLATAYYLAKEHKITNVAIIEKGWIGGGNVGRNTTIIRSNYMLPGNEPFYELSMKLWEGFEQDLNYNAMVSQRGILNLYHNDAQRDGFIPAEGAGILILETLEYALNRGATILAEIVGYGASSDAFHPVQPEETGVGAARAIQLALDDAGVSPQEVDYINAHGTSTPVGDITELKAVGEVFKESIPKISSTKSLSGHSLGATSAHEAIYSLIMMKNNFISASINIADMDDEAKKYPIVTKVEKDVTLNSIMSNSFGFGGTNATLVFEKV